MSQPSAFDRVTLESQGIPSHSIADFIEGVESQHLGLHSLMLLRNGRLVADAWWKPFAPDLPHILYSLTKSFTSTAAGFAISEGRLSLDDQVISFFPRSSPKNPSDNLRGLRVRHLLSMVTGHESDPTGELAQRPPNEWARAFFEIPLTHTPGTHFVYNSAASHLVSMIVQKQTGQKLVNYLRDRLFRPLGIERPYWETSPAGHNFGGWGLYLRTEEIARFGQMLLQRGMWNGQQVVPAAWVEQATSKQVPNGDDPNSDWAQGYGFQFWMSRHGFRGDGAFGQFCVVLPEHDTVLATTAATPDMQAVLNVAWQTLLPGLGPDSLQEAPGALASLRDRMTRLEVDCPQGAQDSPLSRRVSGRHYRLDENKLGWKSLSMQLEGDRAVFVVWTASSDMHLLPAGMTGWLTEKVAMDVPTPVPVAATARWTDDHTLETRACYLNAGMTRVIQARFDEDRLEVRTTLRGSFAPPEEVVLTGRAHE